jgi:hypothetical protein
MPQIDSMIVEWGRRADRVFWKALGDEFTNHRLIIQPFTNGDGFYQNVTRFIDNQTNNVDNQNEDARYATYAAFADTVWDKRIEPIWLPLLKREGMVTENQATDIKAKMDIWKSKVKPTNYLLYVIIGGVLLIAIVLIFVATNRKRRTPAPAPAP